MPLRPPLLPFGEGLPRRSSSRLGTTRGYSRCRPSPTWRRGGWTRVPIDPSSDRPLFRQLADELRSEIRSGKRARGSKLPTESEFQAEYGVSRTTVRGALRLLETEGLVVTRKGYGSFVRERPPIRRVASVATLLIAPAESRSSTPRSRRRTRYLRGECSRWAELMRRPMLPPGLG
jgi:DNA-binding transcriptional regulator YhcF (GntR family)